MSKSPAVLARANLQRSKFSTMAVLASTPARHRMARVTTHRGRCLPANKQVSRWTRLNLSGATPTLFLLVPEPWDHAHCSKAAMLCTPLQEHLLKRQRALRLVFLKRTKPTLFSTKTKASSTLLEHLLFQRHGQTLRWQRSQPVVLCTPTSLVLSDQHSHSVLTWASLK